MIYVYWLERVRMSDGSLVKRTNDDDGGWGFLGDERGGGAWPPVPVTVKG